MLSGVLSGKALDVLCVNTQRVWRFLFQGISEVGLILDEPFHMVVHCVVVLPGGWGLREIGGPVLRGGSGQGRVLCPCNWFWGFQMGNVGGRVVSHIHSVYVAFSEECGNRRSVRWHVGAGMVIHLTVYFG